jgi:hypothetical protein
MENLNLLDTIATLKPIPLKRLHLVESDYVMVENLPVGQVGTVVNIYNEQEEPHYLVEFADLQGREYAMATLKRDEVLILHYELSVA